MYIYKKDDFCNEAIEKVKGLTTKTEFFIRDLFERSQILLGRWFYKAVYDGTITGVTFLGNIYGVDRYQKL